MSLTSRGRSTARRAIRVQRRVALAQALLWPALIGTTLLVGAVVALTMRGRRRAAEWTPAAEPQPVAAGHDAPVVSRT